jgi:uncharacterized protein (DUF1330 family)
VAAYVISDLQIRDAELVKGYRPLAAASIAQYGGRYLTRFGAIETAEGGWTPSSIVIIEFDSMQRAREWWNSPEYAPARAIAARALNRRVIFVDGVTTQPAS